MLVEVSSREVRAPEGERSYLIAPISDLSFCERVVGTTGLPDLPVRVSVEAGDVLLRIGVMVRKVRLLSDLHCFPWEGVSKPLWNQTIDQARIVVGQFLGLVREGEVVVAVPGQGRHTGAVVYPDTVLPDIDGRSVPYFRHKEAPLEFSWASTSYGQAGSSGPTWLLRDLLVPASWCCTAPRAVSKCGGELRGGYHTNVSTTSDVENETVHIGWTRGGTALVASRLDIYRDDTKALWVDGDAIDWLGPGRSGAYCVGQDGLSGLVDTELHMLRGRTRVCYVDPGTTAYGVRYGEVAALNRALTLQGHRDHDRVARGAKMTKGATIRVAALTDWDLPISGLEDGLAGVTAPVPGGGPLCVSQIGLEDLITGGLISEGPTGMTLGPLCTPVHVTNSGYLAKGMSGGDRGRGRAVKVTLRSQPPRLSANPSVRVIEFPARAPSDIGEVMFTGPGEETETHQEGRVVCTALYIQPGDRVDS